MLNGLLPGIHQRMLRWTPVAPIPSSCVPDIRFFWFSSQYAVDIGFLAGTPSVAAPRQGRGCALPTASASYFRMRVTYYKYLKGKERYLSQVSQSLDGRRYVLFDFLASTLLTLVFLPIRPPLRFHDKVVAAQAYHQRVELSSARCITSISRGRRVGEIGETSNMNALMRGNRGSHRLFRVGPGAGAGEASFRHCFRLLLPRYWSSSLPVGYKGWRRCTATAGRAQSWPNLGRPFLLGRRRHDPCAGRRVSLDKTTARRSPMHPGRRGASSRPCRIRRVASHTKGNASASSTTGVPVHRMWRSLLLEASCLLAIHSQPASRARRNQVQVLRREKIRRRLQTCAELYLRRRR